MEKVIVGFIFGVLLVVLLAAAGGSGDLKTQLQQPEGQQAIAAYIQQHCSSDVNPAEIKQALAAQDGRQVFVHTFCWSDSPAK